MSTLYIEASGRTIDEAVATALEKLKLDRDSVNVEVIEKPKAGFLGIGSAPAKIRVFYEYSKEDKTRDYLTKLFSLMGIETNLEISKEMIDGETVVSVNMTGNEMGLLIGRRGESLDALQYITNLSVNKGEEEKFRVRLDTENYRAKRQESLERLAAKAAEKVLKYRKSISLDIMPSSDRKIIHTALQDNKEVTTFSTGNEPARRVIVALANSQGKKPRYSKQGKPVKKDAVKQAPPKTETAE